VKTFVPRWSTRFSTDTPQGWTDKTDTIVPSGDSGGSVSSVGASLAHSPECCIDAGAEWRVQGCPGFCIAHEARDPERAACLRCGAALHAHDHPSPTAWHVVDDAELVEIAQVRFVIAKAQAIARGEG
jgi:hypothetical protein